MRGLDFKVNSLSGEKGEKREGRRKEAEVVPLHLLYPGKMKAVQLFLRSLEKLVVINRNLTHITEWADHIYSQLKANSQTMF